MSFWAFTKGAASTLRKEIEREEMVEEERMEWQRRLEFQQKLQEQAEKAKRDRETLLTTVDLERGVIEEQSRSGGVTETKLSPSAVKQLKEKKALEDAALARKAELEAAKLDQSKAAAESSRTQASTSLAARARLDGRAERQNALDEARRKKLEAEIGKSPGGSKKVNALVTDIGKADPAANRIALAIKHNATLSEEEKEAELAALLQRALQK